MAGRGFNWDVLQLPLGYGLYTKDDARFSSPPALDVARDVRFEQVGGLQPRLPFAAMNNTVFGGGTLANCRRLAVVNGELCVFTDAAFYSWNASLASWVNRGAYVAASVDEQPRCETTDDQIDPDRAELNGTVIFSWTTQNGAVAAAAMDKATGAMLVAPTQVSTAVGKSRLVALATKILLFVDAGANNLTVRAIDPSSPATGITGSGTTVAAGVFGGAYDVQRAGTQDLCVGAHSRTPATSYTAFTVTPSLAVSTSTKARSIDGPVAVATIPDGTKVQVIRNAALTLQGDLLTTSGLGDIFTNQAIGAPTLTFAFNTLTCAFRSVQNGGQFRCYVFWGEHNSTKATTTFNFVDTGNTVGASAVLCRNVELASAAFDYAGSVYVWGVYALPRTGTGVTGAQLQNTCFLFRDDKLLVAKSNVAIAGGYVGALSDAELARGTPAGGRMPGVANPSPGVYTWCSTWRRRVPLGNDGQGYSARSPREVTVTFDSDLARRSVQLGRTLYISSAEGLMQYDGTRLVEVGFHTYPDQIAPIGVGGGGSISAGTYAVKATLRYPNAQGETERSTSAAIDTVVTSAGGTINITSASVLNVTHKTAVPPAIEFWRTVVNPPLDAPFYLVSSNDPSLTSNPNRYVANDQTTTGTANFTDTLADAAIIALEQNQETGSVLESLAPPPATIVVATDTRLFIAGISGDPHRIWYSRERNDGEIASFNDGLTIDVPPAGGALTAIWLQDGVLYAGRQTAVYALPGVGLDNAGNGQGFGPAQIVSLDVGPVSQDAVCLTPLGTLFKTSKGWYLLEGGRTLRYVGSSVSTFDADTVCSVHVITSQHQVRVLTNNRVLIWDYRGLVDIVGRDGYGDGAWAEWTISGGLHAAMWNGTYVYLTSTGPLVELTTFTGVTYGMDIETSWIKASELQGYQKLGAILVLGEYRSACLVRVRVARDYQYDGAGNVVWFDDIAWSPSPTTVNNALQLKHCPSSSNGWGQAFKIRISAVAEQARAALATSTLAVATSGTNWTATWTAASARPGEMGNAISMSLAFELGASLIDVRDHFVWNAAVGRWVESLNTIGVRVACLPGALTVAALESAITAATSLATLGVPDATPSKTLSAAALNGTTHAGAFAGGAYGAPSGEAIRLTGIGLEVARMGTLNKRLPAAQKQ